MLEPITNIEPIIKEAKVNDDNEINKGNNMVFFFFTGFSSFKIRTFLVISSLLNFISYLEESLNILGLGSCKGINQEILNLVVKDRINQVITDSKLYDSMDYKLLKEQINKILEAGKSISLHVNNISNKVKQLNSK